MPRGRKILLLEEVVELLSGGHLDDAAEDVGGDRVVPFGPRLEQQREAGPDVAGLGQVRAGRRAPLEPGRAVQRVHRVHPVEAVGEPGRVGEQVPDPDRLGGGDGHLLLVRAAVVDADVVEGRDEFADRVGEREPALLVQDHRGDRGDRLGHRVDAPQGVVGHRQPRLDVARPAPGHVRQVAVPADREQPAGQAPVFHVAGEVRVDALESFFVQPEFGRIGLDGQLGHGTSMR